MKRILNLLLCITLTLSLTAPALAAGSQLEQESAAAWLKEQGIMTGDQNGNLGLASGLTRAELAVILTRLHGEGQVDPNHYTWACYFTDVPGWAKPYVGYCVAHLLVSGYDETRYGPGDPVTPDMACTVILRTCGYERGEGTDWNYRTACDYAARLGLIDRSAAQNATITRGEMAVLICRALKQEELPPVKPEPVPQADGVTIGPDGTITGKTVTVSDWSREDFSQQANPAIFTGCYTRGWYNALRQSIVDRDAIVAGNNEDDFNPRYLYAHTLVPDSPAESFHAFSYILSRIHGYSYYRLSAEPYTKNQYEYPGYAIIRIASVWHNPSTLAFIQPELNSLHGMDDRSKVIELNRYLCGLMEYHAEVTGVLDAVFSDHATPVHGQCTSYSTAFTFLCTAADIPCIRIFSTTHSWNEVYVDGQWLSVDVSANDISANQNAYLLTTRQPGTDQCPDATRFVRELVVPGSTK